MTARAYLLTMIVVARALGEVWRVPADCPTIQAGLDSLGDGDTLVVGPGLYAESLIAPSLGFVWVGVTDTAHSPDRPVVDPSSLESPRERSCLTLPPQSRAVIRNVIFRNGAAMFPHVASIAGGIQNESDTLDLQSCTFDSTYLGVMSDVGTIGGMRIVDCRFENNVNFCLVARSSGPAEVTFCLFSGYTHLAWLYPHAVVEDCHFQLWNSGDWLWLWGEDITIRDCTFGPTEAGAPAYSVILAGAQSGCLYENNRFANLEVRRNVISLAGNGGDPTLVLDNVFKNCRAVDWGLAAPGLVVSGQDYIIQADVINCVFDSCVAAQRTMRGPVVVTRNMGDLSFCRITGHDVTVPAMYLLNFDEDSLTGVSNCAFDRTDWAMHANYVSAEYCWWGDPSGPYHEILNPMGMGDSVTGDVDFDPWLTEPPLTAPARPATLPRDVSLDVFPNPFNATATVVLACAVPGTYEVVLYNSLGQRVKDLWSGYAAGEQRITVMATGLSSGLYVACARKTDTNGTAALAKVLYLK